MTGSDDSVQDVSSAGRDVAIRIPLVAGVVADRARRLPAPHTLLLAGILFVSGAMAMATIVVGVSMSRGMRDLVDRIDRDQSARMFEQAALRSMAGARVYVLPALRAHSHS